MAITQKNVFITSDKMAHDTELEALVHEQKIELRKYLYNLDTDIIVSTPDWRAFNETLYKQLISIGEIAQTILDGQKKVEILQKM